MRISRKLKARVKLGRLRAYQIAQKACMHPTVLSKIINGIEKVEFGDPRVLRLASVLGLSEAECFEAEGTRKSQIGFDALVDQSSGSTKRAGN